MINMGQLSWLTMGGLLATVAGQTANFTTVRICFESLLRVPAPDDQVSDLVSSLGKAEAPSRCDVGCSEESNPSI